MYLCYVDESGLHSRESPVVTVGVLVEGSQRLIKTSRQWTEQLGNLLTEGDVAMNELKSSQMYRGSGKWNRLRGDERHRRIEGFVDWFVERKHHLALAAVDGSIDLGDSALTITDPELLAALHIALQVQRAHQTKEKNKGATLLVMDQSKVAGRLTDLLEEPPAWSDDYYGREQDAEPFDQLVHTPFWVPSDRIELVQLADLFAFIYRRYVEVCRNGEDYEGERVHLERWRNKLDTRLLGRSHRLPTRAVSPATRDLVSAFPSELRRP